MAEGPPLSGMAVGAAPPSPGFDPQFASAWRRVAVAIPVLARASQPSRVCRTVAGPMVPSLRRRRSAPPALHPQRMRRVLPCALLRPAPTLPPAAHRRTPAAEDSPPAGRVGPRANPGSWWPGRPQAPTPRSPPPLPGRPAARHRAPAPAAPRAAARLPARPPGAHRSKSPAKPLRATARTACRATPGRRRRPPPRRRGGPAKRPGRSPSDASADPRAPRRPPASSAGSPFPSLPPSHQRASPWAPRSRKPPRARRRVRQGRAATAPRASAGGPRRRRR